MIFSSPRLFFILSKKNLLISFVLLNEKKRERKKTLNQINEIDLVAGLSFQFIDDGMIENQQKKINRISNSTLVCLTTEKDISHSTVLIRLVY